MRRIIQVIFVTFVLAATVVFAWGFALGSRGSVGVPLNGEPVSGVDETEVRQGAARLVIVGDSLARGAGDATGRGIGGNLQEILEEEGQDVEWLINLGVDGARTADLLARLEPEGTRRTISEATLIVLSIGANDVFYESGRGGTLTEVEPEEIIGRVRKVLAELETINSEAPVFIIGLYNPFPEMPETAALDAAVAEWNYRLSELAVESDETVVIPTADLFIRNDRLSPDRFHPSEEAYELIARRISEVL